MEEPLYVSRRTVRSMGQEYRVYSDRVELELLGHIIRVPLEQIRQVEVSPPTVTLAGLRLHFHPFRFGIKLDFSDLAEHVMLDKDTGLCHRLDFTPDEPAAFKAALDRAMEALRKR